MNDTTQLAMDDPENDPHALAQEYIRLIRAGKPKQAKELKARNPEMNSVLEFYTPLLMGASPLIDSIENACFCDGRFKIKRVIKTGAQGIIYEAMDTQANDDEPQTVALKVFRVNHENPEELRKSHVLFKRNVGHLLRLQHDHVIKILAHEAHEVGQCFAMPLFDGNLSDLRKTVSNVFAPKLLKGFIQLADAISFCNLKYVIHRDLKPQNILYKTITHEDDRSHHMVVADFDLMKPLKDEIHSTSVPKGTPPYMSPEQLKGDDPDFHTDVWGFGAVLFWWMSGKSPVKAVAQGDVNEGMVPLIRMRQALKNLPPIAELCPNAPRDLCRIVEKCLRFNPDDRYDGMWLVKQDLERFANGRPLLSEPIHRKITKLAKRHWLVTVVVLSVSAVIGLWVQDKWSDLQKLARKNSELKLQTNIARESERVAVKSRLILLRDQVSRLEIDGDYTARNKNIFEIHEVEPAIDTQLRLATAPTDQTAVLVKHDGPVSALLESGKHNVLVSAGMDGRLLVTRLSDQKLLATCEKGIWSEDERRYFVQWEDDKELDVYSDLAWIDEGQSFVGVTITGRIVRWTVEGEKVDIANFAAPIVFVNVNPDSGDLVVGCDDGLVYTINRPNYTIGKLADVKSAATACTFLPGNRTLVGTADGRLIILDLDGTTVWESSEIGPIRELLFETESDRIVVATGQPTPVVFRYNEDRLEYRRELRMPVSRPTAEVDSLMDISLNSIGTEVLGAMESGYLIRWNMNSGRIERSISEIYRTTGTNNWPTIPVAFQRRFRLSNGRFDTDSVLYGSYDGTVKQWQWFGTVAPETFHLSANCVVAPDGIRDELLWEGCVNGNVRVWDLARNKLLAENSESSSQVIAVRTSRTGKTLVVHKNGRIRVVDFLTYGRIKNSNAPIDHSAQIRTAALSPDGKSAALIDEENVLNIIDIASGKTLATNRQLHKEPGNFRFVDFDAAGAKLIVAGPIGMTLLVSAKTGQVESQRQNVGLGKRGAMAVDRLEGFGSPFVVGDSRGGVMYVRSESSHVACRDRVGPAIDVTGVYLPEQFEPRLLVADASGVVEFFDKEFYSTIPLWRLKSPIDAQHNPVTDVVVTSLVGHMVLLHQSGAATVWHTRSNQAQTAVSPTGWSEHELKPLHNETYYFPNDAVLSIGNGEFVGIWSAQKNLDQWDVHLGKWTSDGQFTGSILLGTVAADRLHSRYQVEDAMAISRVDDDLIVVARDSLGNWATRIHYWRITTDPSLPPAAWTKVHETVKSPSNSCFYPFIHTNPDGLISVLHFSHDGHYAHVSKRNSIARWTTNKLGRKGMGFRMRCNSGPEGIWAAYVPHLFGSGCTPLQADLLGPDFKPNKSTFIVRDPVWRSFSSTESSGLNVFAIRQGQSYAKDLEWIRVVSPSGAEPLAVSREVVMTFDPVTTPLCVAARTLRDGQLACVYEVRSRGYSTFHCVKRSGDEWNHQRIGRVKRNDRRVQLFETADGRLTLLVPPSASTDGEPLRLFTEERR